MEVQAREKWNDTGIDAAAGDRFSVIASGSWKDGSIAPCGPEGYTRWYLAAFGWLRRAPAGRWFELIAQIRPGGRPKRIGRSAEFTADADGRLYLYANDVPFRYANNRGSVDATVRKLP